MTQATTLRVAAAGPGPGWLGRLGPPRRLGARRLVGGAPQPAGTMARPVPIPSQQWLIPPRWVVVVGPLHSTVVDLGRCGGLVLEK